jgi:hypothetical protein
MGNAEGRSPFFARVSHQSWKAGNVTQIIVGSIVEIQLIANFHAESDETKAGWRKTMLRDRLCLATMIVSEKDGRLHLDEAARLRNN